MDFERKPRSFRDPEAATIAASLTIAWLASAYCAPWQEDPESAKCRRSNKLRAFLFAPDYGYNSHETEIKSMRSVNVAELKNQLSKYLTFAKSGEEIVIRDRNLPVAKLVPFSTEEGTEEELLLVAAGKMRLPQNSVDLEKALKIPTGRLVGREGTRALLEDREQSL